MEVSHTKTATRSTTPQMDLSGSTDPDGTNGSRDPTVVHGSRDPTVVHGSKDPTELHIPMSGTKDTPSI